MKTKCIIAARLLVPVIALYFLSGCSKEEMGPLQVSTTPVTVKTSTSITCGGDIPVISYNTIDYCGICWSTDPDPTTNDKVIITDVAAQFSCTLPDLQPGTRYYLRAFAVRGGETGYGAVVTCNTYSATIPSYIPMQGLVAWWPFNGNAEDESGNDYELEVHEATLTIDRFDSVNAAFYFDGTNDYLSREAFTTLNDCSVSLWVKMTTRPGTGEPNNYAGFFAHGRRGSSGYGLEYSDNQLCISAFGVADNVTASTFNPPLDTWYHYVVVKSNTSFALYINNTLSSFGYEASNPPAGYFSIGGCANSSNDPSYICFLNGSVDDVAMWDRSLTQGEITALYNGEK